MGTPRGAFFVLEGGRRTSVGPPRSGSRAATSGPPGWGSCGRPMERDETQQTTDEEAEKP